MQSCPRPAIAFLGLTLSIAASASIAQVIPGEVEPGFSVTPARETFLRDHPAVRFYPLVGDRIGRVYGNVFSTGASPIESAERFRLEHAGIFGVTPDQLVLEGPFPDKNHLQPILWDPKLGDYRFYGVYYAQKVQGVPVHGGVLKLLVRNEPGFPLVLAAADLRPLGGNPDGLVVGAAAPRDLEEESFAGRALDQFRSKPSLRAIETVIYAGVGDDLPAPRLATRFEAEGGTVFDPANYRKFLYVTDPATGRILHQENLVLHQSVEGVVQALATEGIGADTCAPESVRVMPYARLLAGSQTIFADVNGAFSVVPPTGSAVNLLSQVRGQYFVVNSQNGVNSQVQITGTVGQTATILHNAANATEFTRAEVNAYIHSNVVRDFALLQNPGYPVIAGQTAFPVNVNLAENCNAFYNQTSINFYDSGGGCTNTANSTVVYHEYGHHLINVGGSGQGQYGEGMSDTVAVVITDDPNLGLGFQSNCSNPLRSAVNDVQYPCTGAIHSCGRLLSGSVWDTRQAMVLGGVEDYRDVMASLVINSILLHTGTEITPQITIDFITLDDDNGSIDDGSPHYEFIDAGFSLHNMDAPPLALLRFEFPQQIPALFDPAGTTTFPVRVLPLGGQPSGTVQLAWREVGGTTFSFVTLPAVGGDTYACTMPAVECGTQIQFYFAATTTSGQTVTSPSGGSTTPLTATAGESVETRFVWDMETNPGFSVSNSSTLTDGAWERGAPIGGGTRGDPPTDFDPAPGTQCWLTANRTGNSDVDGGATTLITPIFDGTGENVSVCYARWFSNTQGNSPNQDVFRVDISNDGGTSWVPLEVVGPGGPQADGGWYRVCFVIGGVLEPTTTMRVRFIADDVNPGSVVEAGIDAFEVSSLVCGSSTPGDVNGDGVVNGIDLAAVLGAWGNCPPKGACPADVTGDGTVDGVDLSVVLGNWTL